MRLRHRLQPLLEGPAIADDPDERARRHVVDGRGLLPHEEGQPVQFGLVVQENRPRIFGAGIISGRAELTNTIMEFYRLDRDGVLDFRNDIYQQICDQFYKHEADVDRIKDGMRAVRNYIEDLPEEYALWRGAVKNLGRLNLD